MSHSPANRKFNRDTRINKQNSRTANLRIKRRINRISRLNESHGNTHKSKDPTTTRPRRQPVLNFDITPMPVPSSCHRHTRHNQKSLPRRNMRSHHSRYQPNKSRRRIRPHVPRRRSSTNQAARSHNNQPITRRHRSTTTRHSRFNNIRRCRRRPRVTNQRFNSYTIRNSRGSRRRRGHRYRGRRHRSPIPTTPQLTSGNPVKHSRHGYNAKSYRHRRHSQAIRSHMIQRISHRHTHSPTTRRGHTNSNHHSKHPQQTTPRATNHRRTTSGDPGHRPNNHRVYIMRHY